MSITQENIKNITIQHGELEKLLEYVAQNGLNDILQYQIAETLEELENEETEIALFSRVAARLESIGWQPSQIKKAIEILAKVTREERKELRTVTVSHTPAFMSGLINVSRALEQSPGRLIQAFLWSNGTADADLQLFDSPDLLNCPNNDLLLRVRCPGASLSSSESLKEEIPFISGLTAVLQGTGSSYSIEYKILEKGQGG